ncbi:MAG: hypothetical protein HY058_07680, partial [Proteobacteria bacterium]|nr:hypothetical protein [Pseudomonadota bacterium]
MMAVGEPPFENGEALRELGRSVEADSPLDRAIGRIEGVQAALRAAARGAMPPLLASGLREFIHGTIKFDAKGDGQAWTGDLDSPIEPRIGAALARVAAHLKSEGGAVIVIPYLVRTLIDAPADARALEQLARVLRGLHYQFESAYGALGFLHGFLQVGLRALAIARHDVDLLFQIGVSLGDVGRFEDAHRIYSAMVDAQERRRQAMGADNSDFEIVLTGLLFSIGHVGFLDYFIKLHKLGWRRERKLLVLAESDRPFNREFLSYWRRYLTLVEDPQKIQELSGHAEVLDPKIVTMVEANGRRVWCQHLMAEVQKAWDEQARPPLIALKPRDYLRGWEMLARAGLKQGDWFVCLHVRESGFKGEPVKYAANAEVTSYF